MPRVRLFGIDFMLASSACTLGQTAVSNTDSESIDSTTKPSLATTLQPSATPILAFDLDTLGNMEYPLEYARNGVK